MKNWLIIHNSTKTVWIAYNRHDEALTCHLLLDRDLEIYDPDPAVPQWVIEKFWEMSEIKQVAT